MGGVPDYGEYWKNIRQRWLDTDATERQKMERQKMECYLRKKIENCEVPVIKGYPFSCKIAELCLIGEHRKKNQRERQNG